MKIKVLKENVGPIYVMGVQGNIIPKYRIKDGNLVWDELYSKMKKNYPNFKRNEKKELVLWGCMSDIRKGFYPITSNDYLINYFCGIEVYDKKTYAPFEIYEIPKCVFVTCFITSKEFKLEYTKIVKEVKKYIEKNDYNLVGPIQEKYEGDNVTLYFPIEILR